jgi:hypothetical protein
MRLTGGADRGRAIAISGVCMVLILGLFVAVLSRPALAHTADVILALPSFDEVLLDGEVTATEWADAESVMLRPGSVGGPETTLAVKHNDSFLFVALDAIGDLTEDRGDQAWIAFDTEHDGLAALGREDIFFHSEFFEGGQAHYTFDGRAWSIQDSPYDAARPHHLGLASEWSFGPSNGSALDHRQVEFRIPLALLGGTPGDVVGFLVTVIDVQTGGQSSWPQPLPRGQLNDYGDLLLTTPAGPADLLLLPPTQEKAARAGVAITYELSVTNRGSGGSDTFDFTTTSAWEVTLWDSTGTTTLGDSDADTLPDTGLLAMGASLALLARVEVPPNATGPNEATVNAASSLDTNVSANALLITELPAARFKIISSARRVVTFGVGNYTVGLSFPGEDIYRARNDGPFGVHLILYDASDTLDQNDHTTQAYDFTAFQKPVAVLAPPHTDTGLDTDGDGFFDHLAVEVQIEVREGGIFLLTADLWGSLIDRTSNFTTLAPGLHAVPVWFDGRHINASDVDGPYQVSLVLYDFVTTEFLDRAVHTTADYLHVEFQTPRAAFASPHADTGLDTDGDGLFDYLVTEARLTVNQADTYRVDGTLSGSRAGFTSNTTTLGAGSHVVPLWFDGVEINVSQIDGPYTVDLQLYSVTTFDLLDAESHTTAAYGHLEFEAPRARFVSPHGDSGRDDDGDSQFDVLLVNVTVEVEVQGKYTVGATLRDADSLFVLSSKNRSTLEVGAHWLQLTFPGPRINASDIDGPYAVGLSLIEDSTSLVLDADAFATSAYSHVDFDAPSGRLLAPHADAGQDKDGDGLFDILVVEAGVVIQEAGSFLIEAYLSNPTFQLSLFGFNVTSLEAGSQFVELAFDGVAINLSGRNGPYLVELYLYDWDTFEFLDNETHTTQSYGHHGFDGPAARLGSPHSDRGMDTNGDGAFNSLVVLVEVDVAEEGTFSLNAFIYDPSFTLFFSAGNVTTLDIGLHAVAVVFDGARINATRVDGPYTVEISLTDVATLRLLDSDVHTTANYAAVEFEGPEPLLATPSVAPPTIDGAIAQGEWDDAAFVNLEDITGNGVPGFLLVTNDWRYVYIAYDATGDTTEDAFDLASIAFDTGNDGVPTTGREDQFVQGGGGANDQGHYVYLASIATWVLQDSPYDARLPGHEGLASAAGFGASGRETTPHRVYEFAIPLALIGAMPGEVLGFFGGSQFVPGLFDDSSGEWSLWPVWNSGPLGLSAYGTLVLGISDDLVPPTLVILDPAPDAILGTGDVRVTWFARDFQSGVDYLEVSLDSGDATVLPPTVFSHTFSGLAEGPHTVRLRAVDVSDNAQTEFLNFTVDTVPPTVLIISPFPDVFLNRSRGELAWVAGDATSGVSTLRLVLDGEVLATLPATTTRTFVERLDEGRHVFEVQATDRAGHVGTDSVAFTVDTVAPVLYVSLPESEVVITTSRIEVAWEASDPTSGVTRFEVRLDDRQAFVFPATSASFVLSDVQDGMHTVNLSAFDRAGNEETVAISFRVDTNPLSPTGPFGVGPLAAVIATAGVAAVVLFLLFLRKRGRPPS